MPVTVMGLFFEDLLVNFVLLPFLHVMRSLV